MAYVYEIRVDDVRRYVGKGTRKRLHEHMRVVRSVARRRAAGELVETTQLYAELTAAWLEGAEIVITKIADGLSEREALDLEQSMIEVDRDQLWNTYRRGRPTSERHLASTRSESFRLKQSEHAKRVLRSPETVERQRSAMKTPEARATRAAATRASWADPEKRARRVAGLRNRNACDSKKAKVLTIIRENPGISFKSLRASTGSTRGGLSTLVYEMCESGLIERSGPYHNRNYTATNVTPFSLAG